jgi:hypothetical protein
MVAAQEVAVEMNVDSLRQRLAAVRQKSLVCILLSGGALVVTAAVSLLSLGMVADWLGELPWLVRAGLLAGNVALLGYLIGRQVVGPLRRAPREDECALLVEQAMPEFQSRLIATVQLTRPGALGPRDSAALVEVLAAQTAALAAPVRFTAVVDARPSVALALGAAVVTLAAAVVMVAGGPLTAALWQRALLQNVPVPHKTRVEVLTGSVRVGQGDTVALTARAHGVVPAAGKLSVVYAAGQKQQFTLPALPEPAATFGLTLENVQESFRYTVRLNDDTSAEFAVTVRERPVVTRVDCQQVYPAYTRLGTVPRAVTDLALLAGSRLQLQITANKPIATAALRLAELNAEAPLRVDAADRRRLSGEISIPPSGLTGLAIQLVDEDGLRTKEGTLYRVDILPDKAPTITVTYPERKEELMTARAVATVGVEAADDFGVATLRLHYQTPAVAGGQPQVVEWDLGGATPRALRRRHEWPLASLAASLPVDTAIEWWVEARDTNDVTGPGVAQSEHYWFRIVTEEEKRTDLMNRLDDYLNLLGTVAEDQERLNQNLGTLIFRKAP